MYPPSLPVACVGGPNACTHRYPETEMSGTASPAAPFAADARAWVDRYFAEVDTLSPEAILAWYTDDDPSFRFASAPPAVGKAAIAEMLRGFFAEIASMSHTRTGFWADERTAVFEADVRFGKKGGGFVIVPAASILRLDAEGRIRDFRMLMDAAPLFADD